MHLQQGSKVEHADLGAGTIKALLDGGRSARILFDGLPGVPYTLPTSQLNSTPGGPSPTPRGATGRRAPARRHGGGGARATTRRRRTRPRAEVARPSMRQMFEALRMGVVPPAHLGEYTVGRSEEVERLRELIAARRGLVVLEGHYGAGKSHMIELGISESRAAGFLTSRVSFDAVEVPPSNPRRIYRELVGNLRYPPGGAAGGLTPLFDRLRKSDEHKGSEGRSFHRYLSPALFAHADGSAETAESVVAYVEGRAGTRGDDLLVALRRDGWRGPALLALPDWRTFGQVLLYLVGGISSWARDAGYAGLAVFFDEAESLDSLGPTSRKFAETVLRYFSAATIPESELPFDPRSLYRGGHAVHRRLPHEFAHDQPLLSCFAFTPLREVTEAVIQAGVGPSRLVHLEQPTQAHLIALSRRLVELYFETYALPRKRGAEASKRLARHIERSLRFGLLDTTRAVARLTVEYLDLLRHRPDLAAVALEER